MAVAIVKAAYKYTCGCNSWWTFT